MATLRFVRRAAGRGVFICGGITIDVTNVYTSSFEGEDAETQADKVRRLLAGERGLIAMYSNRNGESELSIFGDYFSLNGGAYGPAFGDGVSIEVCYSDNKAAIDGFLTFMLEGGDESGGDTE